MLIVLNPRIDPETTAAGWLRHNARVLALMLLWVVALLFAVLLAQPDGFGPSAWYQVSAAEGLPSYAAYGSEQACTAASPSSLPAACVSGEELNR